MLEWCMVHPWMTFFIIIAILAVVENIFVVINNSLKVKVYEIQSKSNKE